MAKLDTEEYAGADGSASWSPALVRWAPLKASVRSLSFPESPSDSPPYAAACLPATPELPIAEPCTKLAVSSKTQRNLESITSSVWTLLNCNRMFPILVFPGKRWTGTYHVIGVSSITACKDRLYHKLVFILLKYRRWRVRTFAQRLQHHCHTDRLSRSNDAIVGTNAVPFWCGCFYFKSNWLFRRIRQVKVLCDNSIIRSLKHKQVS